MSLYLGDEKITPIIEPTIAWWGGRNPKLLYTAIYSKSLAETNYPSLSITDSAASTITFPSTSYTSTASANVIFDRWGSGASNHNGTALNFAEYDYCVVADNLIDIKYTTEPTGKGRVIRSTSTGIYPISQIPKVASNNIVYPTSTTAGTTVAGSIHIYYIWYRNTSNNLAMVTTSRGFYFSAIAPSFQSTTSLTPTYINFRTPTVNMRASATYCDVSVYPLVDTTNTIITFRQQLYQIKKGTSIVHFMGNRQAQMYENIELPELEFEKE